MDNQLIIEQLNQKKYCQQMGPAGDKVSDLTDEEKAFITTFHPESALIIYGSLAPNRPNHFRVESIKGTWQKGIIRGSLENKGWGAELGFNGFRPAYGDEQQEIPVYVLTSDELAAHWARLDDFEGTGYRRILAPFELENGTSGIGNIYALNED